ncbi:interleukin-13 receptor subunit alpha-2 [Cyprinodon tularosa]|uniref:interleukin-13 receptor subunit alpha-2 n=1 Tax=Cyprinodon tularosa TaxID=77115 RepID=UPI0018E1E9DB|nr:interleukin-13 receptor subunit alpha-2 [Cyprinodon tularosa]
MIFFLQFFPLFVRFLPMANRSGALPLLMLIFLTWRGGMPCCAITVDPPEDLAVLDSGRLGRLEIVWRLPSSLMNMTKCQLQYQLEYFNAYKNKWEVLRTLSTTYSAQFDLSKDVQVKVFTILNGECTNNKMIKSKDYSELVVKPPNTGIWDTEATDFTCMYHNMENLECIWTSSQRTPASAQQNLFFWHRLLEQAVECPSYIFSGGVRKGCNFTGKPLPEFSDIYFCVNGSSSKGPLKPAYFSLQIQNHVKTAAPDKLNLQTRPDRHLEISWENPAGKFSVDCLEWEVRHHHVGADGTISSKQIHARNPSLTLTFNNSSEINCFKVRSRLNSYCVDKSIWSDWSPETCHPEMKNIEPTVEPEMTLVSVYLYIAVAIVAILMVSLCVWAAINMRKSKPGKKVDSLLPKLIPKTLTLGVSKICSSKKITTDVMV